MTSPATSYVIPAYNAADTLAASVASLMEGNWKPGDEVLLVDDASTDGTLKLMRKLAMDHPAIRVLQHSVNRGSAAAGRNTAIEQATHDVIFCLDADNALVPNSVPALQRFMAAEAAEAAAFQELRYFRHGDQPERITHKWVFRSSPVTLADALAGAIWPGPSGNYMFTRASWLKAGRYDEGVGAGVDSWAFGIRQLAAGTRMVIMPDSGYYHCYGHESAFVREQASTNISLVALRGLLPILPRLERRDADYVMSRRGREHWFEDLESRPLRLHGEPTGKTGRVEYLTIAPPPVRQCATWLQRLRWHWRRLCERPVVR
jgi:glycosyltransferase involved in cell wall biosynthesis